METLPDPNARSPHGSESEPLDEEHSVAWSVAQRYGLRDREVPVTMAGEGMPRRAWTVDQIMAMNEAGIIHENERFELIGGEVIPMNSKGIFHERVKGWLTEAIIRTKPDDVALITETTFRLSADTFVEPDVLLFSRADGLENVSGTNALLVIEVSDSTRRIDLGSKSEIYAAFGVREYWSVDAREHHVTVYREPTPLGYRRRFEVMRGEPARPHLIDGLALDFSKVDEF